jgi:outer membrane protein OmpA-like peptidoglycan-associated protein
MNRVILSAVLAATSAASGAFAADVYNDTGSWYLSPMGTYSLMDRDRLSKDDFGYQVGIGTNFAPNWAGEVNYSNGSYKIRSLGESQKLWAYSLDFLYKFLPDSTVRPYLIAGGGELNDKIGAGDIYHTYLAEAGAGLLTGIGSQSGAVRLQLRTEAKYRLEFANRDEFGPKDPSDLIFGVGFTLSFGNPVPPPMVAKAAPVVEEPPPPPPPPPPAPEPCHAPAGFQVDANCHIIDQTLVVRAVDFEFNSLRLTEPARDTLDEVTTALKKQPEMQVQIKGFTDSIGTDAYNLTLSQKRADAVKAYLVSKGLSESTLTATGYGKADPISSNATKEGRAQNRRVEFAVTHAPAHVTVKPEEATDASTEAAEKTDPNVVKPKQ